MTRVDAAGYRAFHEELSGHIVHGDDAYTAAIAAYLAALSPCLDGAGAEGLLTKLWFIAGKLDPAVREDIASIIVALRASLARKNTGEATPVAWRGVIDGRTAFLCRTRDEIDRLASDYNATIEPLFASPPLPDTEEKAP
ncbi:hypothetical protein FJ951_26850 [Mesorhizobium sp. B2-2-3]|uniref:hypothetical protein n=1 Tax=Mesorhizobium sp. B2-2-3 TaxID=2589963 RepID=UPI00112DA260|nr:hypothetical protein [Mesorhizobium sp. B2-2-3]TPM39331.1 hypothetical protein FJ951_26850 [Mesorhizobium sp. B2-2-3]